MSWQNREKESQPHSVQRATKFILQPADQSLIKQLVHLIYDVRRDDARFRNRIGLPGSFDEQRKRYPERRELSSLQLKGPFADDRLARLGFCVPAV